MELEKILEEIGSVMRDCGQIMLNADREGDYVSEKAGHANFVTKYDRQVQDMLEGELKRILPAAEFLGEETTDRGGDGKADASNDGTADACGGKKPDAPEGGYVFIVDPIDGTTNFIKDYKVSAISVGLVRGGERVLGAVYNPYLDEMFTAIKGRGAFLNGKRIHVSDNDLSDGIVLFGTSPYNPQLSEKSFKMAYDCFKKAMDIRRSGSAALDFCSVAAGRAELFFELELSPWDFAAGALIVEEAGGVVTDLNGKKMPAFTRSGVIAANKEGQA